MSAERSRIALLTGLLAVTMGGGRAFVAGANPQPATVYKSPT